MPSLWEKIITALREFAWTYQVGLRRFVRCFAIILVLSIAFETFVCNYNYFRSNDYNTICLNDRLELYETKNEQYYLTESNHVIEFSNLNVELKNLFLDFDKAQSAQLVDIKIQFTDEAHRTYFDSTEYTVGVPDVPVSTAVWQSEYIYLNTTGYIDNLRIEVVGEEVSYPLVLDGIYLNQKYPFDFNPLRFFVVAGILALFCVFRPGSGIYRVSITKHVGLSKTVIVGMAVIQVLLVSSFLLYGSNQVGIATSSYNHGAWDKSSIVNTFEVGGDNAQQYAELAKALSKGQLYLEEEPPSWLQEMDEPYDKGARDELQKETGEAALHDVAYYEGKYYVYFGVVPVVLLYLPFYLLTGASFPTAIGVLLSAIAFILGCSVLLDRFARYHFKQVSLGLYLLLQIPLVFCSGMMYLVKFPTFYSLPIMLGLAFSVWGLYFWMKGRSGAGPTGRWYLIGSVCMALVAGCRPQLLVLSLLAFPLFWRLFVTERRLFTPEGAREFMCLIGPYVIIAVALMGYNYARFGAVTDFGANYNLTLNDMTKRGLSVGRFAPAFFAYFIQPPTVTGVFPFLQPAVFETTYMGQTIREVTFGGIFICLPILWVLAFSKRILQQRIAARSTRTVAGVILVLIVGGVLVALLDAQMAGILQRYFADFSFMFLTAAVLLVFIANENLPDGSTAKNLLLKVLIVAVAVSMLYITLMCFVPETNWYSDVYPWAYQQVIEAVTFWN